MAKLRTSMWTRIAAALALLGVLTYATVLPWHVSSRYAQRSIEGAALAGLTVICHPGVATAQSDAAGHPREVPIEQQTNCPVCQGLAAFSLAVVPIIDFAMPVRMYARAFGLPDDERAGPTRRIAAQSRGPPLLA